MPDSLLKNISIVYAEDDPIIRDNIAKFLKRRVGSIRAVENGQDALVQISEQCPDIVLTDLEMPVMGGMEMIEKIRDSYNGDFPIIVITGYKDETHHSALADHHIYKPIDMQLLVETIAESVRSYGKIDRM